MAEDEKDLVPGDRKELSRYDRFVEDTLAEKRASEDNYDPNTSSRVTKGVDEEGDPQLHVFGRDHRAVDEVSNAILSDRVSVRRRPIGWNVDPKEEDELMGPALEELGQSVPRESLLQRLDRGLEGARRVLGLPSTPVDQAGGELAGRDQGKEEQLKKEMPEEFLKKGEEKKSTE